MISPGAGHPLTDAGKWSWRGAVLSAISNRRIDESALSENQRVTLFRVCQEGLNNIVKHADASAVTLQGWQQDETVDAGY